MGLAPEKSKEALQESTLNLIIRQGVSLVSILIHLSLFWGKIPLPLWILIIFQAIVYAPLLNFVPYFKRNPLQNLLLDNAIYGLCLGIWGLNPFLAACYVSASNVISMAAGGVKLCIQALALMFCMAITGWFTQDWEVRSDIPPVTLLIASLGLIAFMSALGMRIFSINSRLRQTRNHLTTQTTELQHLNTLALAVNAHLDVDVIMKSVMQTFERMYPFEALYILSVNPDQQHLEVLGIYGSAITEIEHDAFRQFQFDIERDRHSVFVRGLMKRQIIYLPTITSAMVAGGTKIDKDLFTVKPSVSLAYFPVYVEDKVIAGACFINYHQPFTLNESDLTKIEYYLVQVGTAVRNATLFHELEISKSIAEKARKTAEASEEAKGRFLANMSHEIRTPLTAIMGYSEALMDDVTTEEEKRKFVGYILRSGKHLLSMVNDILDISKIEASKIEIERIPCDLLEILCDIESYISIKGGAKKLYFNIDVTYPIPKVIHSDPTRLKQILLNLCNNAIKFTEIGGITLKIKANEEFIEFALHDTGIGIDLKEQEKIFSAFDQADTSTTRLYGGTGLGLFISKNLAQLLGGDLTVNSAKGIGSCFILTTAKGNVHSDYLRSSEEFADTMEKIKESKTFTGVPSLSGKVLVAEDNPENQNLVTRLIQQTGMSVEIVENGEKAVQAAKNKNYSLILMDMQMPIMGGAEAARLIKKSGVTTPIIAFTANVMKHQVEEYMKLGFANVLEKPIIREALFETLKRTLLKCAKRPGRVLIVEDNEVNQMILFRYVTKANEKAEVVLTANGERALEKVEQEHFDLILMDMEMPIMGGLEATKRIREMGINTPLYIVSGNVSKEDINTCIKAGADGHLAKPLEKAKIYDLINSTLPNVNS